MIIKTIGQLHERYKAGVEFECKQWDNHTAATWAQLDVTNATFSTLVDLLDSGHIRTKPRSVEVVLVFEEGVEHPTRVTFASDFAPKLGYSKHTTHTIPLDGE